MIGACGRKHIYTDRKQGGLCDHPVFSVSFTVIQVVIGCADGVLHGITGSVGRYAYRDGAAHQTFAAYKNVIGYAAADPFHCGTGLFRIYAA